MPGIDSKQAAHVGAASVFGALSGFLILIVAARVLSGPANADFLAFWGALFAVYGILSGVTAESTRAVGRNLLAPPGVPTGGSTLLNAVISGACLAGLILVVSIPLGLSLSPDHGVITAVLVLTSLLYAVHAAVAGSLQAMGRWHSYSALLLLESGFRLLAFAIAASLGLGLLGLEVACLGALLAWPLLLLFSPSARTSLKGKADVPLRMLLRRTGHACASSAASAALVVSYPLLVKVTTSAESFDTAAPILLAISLTRAPILLPLVAFQGVMLTAVLRDNARSWRAAFRPLLAVAVLGVFGAGLAWWIGPRLMTFFGTDYRLEGWVLAALTLSAAAVSVLTLLGTALLGLGYHRVYAAGWVAASIVAFLLLLLPFSTEIRCVLSLLLGPLLGIVIHILALRRVSTDSTRDHPK